MRFQAGARIAIAFVISAIVIAAIWLYVDAAAAALSERIATDDVQDWIRIANRFGGGMNPVMTIAFFFLAGLARDARAGSATRFEWRSPARSAASSCRS